MMGTVANFDDIKLDDDIEQGSKGGPEFKTIILTADNGDEWSNSKWKYPRHRWDISYGVDNAIKYRSLISFYKARRGRERYFRFKDWTDYIATNSPLGVGDGVTAAFQCVKAYDGPLPLVRLIRLPIASTLVVRVDGVASTAYGLDPATGIITFDAQHIPAAGAAITADFEFDMRVRFDTDNLAVSLIWEGAGSIPQLSVIEV